MSYHKILSRLDGLSFVELINLAVLIVISYDPHVIPMETHTKIDACRHPEVEGRLATAGLATAGLAARKKA